MKIKTSRVVAALLLGTIFLTGCSNNASTSASKKTVTTSVSHTKKSATVKNSKALWSNDKDAKLKQFIDQWAPTMNQSYVEYDGKHDLKTAAGTTYPNDLKHVTVNGSNTSIGWNKSGNGNYKYNVVAIYNYNETENHITYFFTFHNGQPVVLVDQSTNGTPALLTTQNNNVKSGFENIVRGKTAEVSDDTASSNGSNSNSDNKNGNSNSTSTESVSDLKINSLMLYEQYGDFTISQDDQAHYILNNPDVSQDGRYYLHTGTTESAMPFTIEGNTAHYWTRLYNGNDTRPDGTEGPSPETEHTISLTDLKAKYYSTDEQKQVLDQVASEMTLN